MDINKLKHDEMKKRTIITSMLLFIVSFVFAQDVNVPAEVLESFKKNYPKAKKETWEKVNDKYQAQFMRTYDHLAIFEQNGDWVKTIITISDNELPDNTSEYISENFIDGTITLMHMIETSEGETNYFVIVNENDVEIKLNFNEYGELQ